MLPLALWDHHPPMPGVLSHCASLPLCTAWANAPVYRQLLRERGVEVVTPEEVQDWEKVRFFVGWNPPPGLLAKVRTWGSITSLLFI